MSKSSQNIQSIDQPLQEFSANNKEVIDFNNNNALSYAKITANSLIISHHQDQNKLFSDFLNEFKFLINPLLSLSYYSTDTATIMNFYLL